MLAFRAHAVGRVGHPDVARVVEAGGEEQTVCALAAAAAAAAAAVAANVVVVEVLVVVIVVGGGGAFGSVGAGGVAVADDLDGAVAGRASVVAHVPKQ